MPRRSRSAKQGKILKRQRTRCPRFVFYSHDGLGLGHVRRNLAVASALVEREPSADILVISGTNEVHRLDLPPRTDVLKLPSLAKVDNNQYRGRSLELPRGDLIRLRGCLLREAVKRFAPDVLVADKHPIGIGGELRKALKTCRRGGGRTVFGLRDILDAPERVRSEWKRNEIVKAIRDLYDRVLVYGDEEVFDTLAEYRVPKSVRAKSIYCGYVMGQSERQVPEPDVPEWGRDDSRPKVLATFGGGEDALSRLKAFVRAATGASWCGIAVAGPLMSPHEFDEASRLAGMGEVRLYGYVHNISQWFDRVNVLVCMGGYNTLVEAVAHRVPTICMPRTAPRLEQQIRAEAFASVAEIHVLSADRDSAPHLRAMIEELLADRCPSARRSPSIRLDGAARAAEELLAEVGRADVQRGMKAPEPHVA